MHTAPQNVKSVRFGSGILKAGGLNLGLLDDAVMAVVYQVLNIKANNGRLPVKKRIESVDFTASLYEINLDNIAAIDTHGVVTSVTASSTPVVAEPHGTWWTVGVPFKLNYKNAANTIVSTIVIKSWATTLTDNTDYDTYVGDGTNGDLGYTYIVPLTVNAWVITAWYSYTPNASKKMVFSDIVKLVNYYALEFINIDEDGKEFKMTIPKAYSMENMSFGFVADDAVDQTMKMPVKFTAYPDATNQMLIIEDEQAV